MTSLPKFYPYGLSANAQITYGHDIVTWGSLAFLIRYDARLDFTAKRKAACVGGRTIWAKNCGRGLGSFSRRIDAGGA